MIYHKASELLEAVRFLKNRKLYIAGAGKYGELIGKYFDKYGIVWDGYLDKRSLLQEVNGKTVYTYDILKVDANGYYVISTCNYKDEIEEELKKMGIQPEHIIAYDEPSVIYKMFADWIEWQKYTKRLERFQGLYKGKRCFIVGNGPSLRLQDLEKLKQEITFGSNSIYALYSHTNWRPTFYCAWDAIFCKEMMSDKGSLQILMQGCEAAFTSLFSEAIKYRDEADMKKLFFMHSVQKSGKNSLPVFSENCAECVYTSGTITYGMLQLAAYMGFQEIYLLGVDCSYSIELHSDQTITKEDMVNHMAIIEEEEKRFYDASYDRYGVAAITYIDQHRAGYEATRQYAQSHGIKVFNATRGGKLDIFERVDFDSLFL